MTSIREQAVKYGEKFTARGKEAWLNVYDLSEDWSGWRVKIFESYDEEWLDYVTACRKEQYSDDYDLVIGGIANDRVFTTINLYFMDLIKKDEAKQTVLDMKFACIIEAYSKEYGVSLEEATQLFYNSKTMTMIERGVADMHCRSDRYLADELWQELHPSD